MGAARACHDTNVAPLSVGRVVAERVDARDHVYPRAVRSGLNVFVTRAELRGEVVARDRDHGRASSRSYVVGDTDGEEAVGEAVGSEVVGEIDGATVGSEVAGEIDGEAVGPTSWVRPTARSVVRGGRRG